MEHVCFSWNKRSKLHRSVHRFVSRNAIADSRALDSSTGQSFSNSRMDSAFEPSPPVLREPIRNWAGQASEYPSHKTVAGIFEEVAQKYSRLTALVSNDRTMKYGDLNALANRLAHRLREMGVGQDVLVGIGLESSFELIVAVLGVLKAGGAYVPFDPSYPQERLEWMLSDAKPKVMVTQSSFAERIWPCRHDQLILMDNIFGSDASMDPNSWDNLPRSESPSQLAYVMYTSGSTGRPKGVMVENRGIVRLVFNRFCSFGPDEVFLQSAPCSFDASTFEIWGALLHGAKLVIPSSRTLSLVDLGSTIQTHHVSTLWLTSGLFNVFVDERIEDLSGVRQLLAGGDVLSARHIRRVLEKFAGTTVINGYGPTENTTFTCCHTMRRSADVLSPIPIGRPIDHTRAYILDGEGVPVGIETPGELYASGDGVARGYLNAPELTAEVFVPDPFCEKDGTRMYRTGDIAQWRADGTIEFMGRKDDQVKINGYRIEPAEVDAVILLHPQIHQACTFVTTETKKGKRLVACYVPEKGHSFLESDLMELLNKKLPRHLVPAACHAMESIPLNANGKVDRAALAAHFAAKQREGRTSD